MTAILRVVLPPIAAAAFSIQPAVDSRPLTRRKFAALLSTRPCRLDSRQFAAMNALSNTAPLIPLALIDVLRKATPVS
ncbi:MAG: hypothetical protein J2P21_05455 [Chloracidobacterium sp.]|nr:hypothetical protein [Chloracidobacterium sp.]